MVLASCRVHYGSRAAKRMHMAAEQHCLAIAWLRSLVIYNGVKGNNRHRAQYLFELYLWHFSCRRNVGPVYWSVLRADLSCALGSCGSDVGC